MSFIWTTVLIVAILAIGAMFFSVCTVALRTFSLAKLQEASKNSNKQHITNEAADILIDNEEKLVMTCSLYRLIFNMTILLLILSVFVRISTKITTAHYLLTFIISVIIFSVFSLAIPHALAKYAGEKILLRCYKLLVFFAALAFPVLYTFRLYDELVRRLAGVAETTPEEDKEEKQEEFLTDLEQHRIEGVVDAEEQEMIENVLELSDTNAAEIMTPRTDIIAVEANCDLNTALKIVTSAGHSRYPVYEKNIDNIIGLLYAKDLLSEIGKEQQQFRLQNKLRKAYFVPETKPLRELLHEFQNQKLHIAVLLDEYGGTAGIVTLEDILEELVGEITDEYEKPEPKPIKHIDTNTVEVDARTYIDDLNDQFELNLPEDDDYDTIGGFILAQLGYIPKIGAVFEYENVKFTISQAQARKIERIRISGPNFIQKIEEKKS